MVIWHILKKIISSSIRNCSLAVHHIQVIHILYSFFVLKPLIPDNHGCAQESAIGKKCKYLFCALIESR